MDFLEEEWYKFVPNEEFNPIFMDDGFASAYRNELRLRRIAGISSLLAIVVCCLGLFGLAAISAQRRTKEIGVRKVLGASAGQIVTMFQPNSSNWSHLPVSLPGLWLITCSMTG